MSRGVTFWPVRRREARRLFESVRRESGKSGQKTHEPAQALLGMENASETE